MYKTKTLTYEIHFIEIALKKGNYTEATIEFKLDFSVINLRSGPKCILSSNTINKQVIYLSTWNLSKS